jgi:enediyne biosynthesis protein E11
VSHTCEVYADLIGEGESLDELVVRLSPRQWTLPTPTPGWTIAHQVAHLASIARLTRAAAEDPVTFRVMAAGAADDFDAVLGRILRSYLAGLPPAILARWRIERAQATKALTAVPADRTVPWLARQLPAGMLAAAGMMELFAHGQDIADTVGARIRRTDRIRHLVGFAVCNWEIGYVVRGLKPPEDHFRFELTLPSGTIWNRGPGNATQLIVGQAVDFCLLVTGRRHRDDLRLIPTGQHADRWLDIAQAYRGRPDHGRCPGQFAA